MHRLAPLVASAYQPLSRETGARYHSFFSEHHYVVLPNFFSDWGFSIIREEAARLAEQATRRDLFMLESNSWRHMATIGSLKLKQLSTLVPTMYHCTDLFDFMAGIAGESLYSVPDQNEQYALNCLLRDGDFHGSHIDSYSYAFNLIIDTPPPGAGGLVRILRVMNGDDRHDDPVDIPLRANDAYLMRTDIAEHMVTSVSEQNRRVAFNFAYKASRDMAQESYSSSTLYA